MKLHRKHRRVVLAILAEISYFDIAERPTERDVSLLLIHTSLHRELAPALGPSH